MKTPSWMPPPADRSGRKTTNPPKDQGVGFGVGNAEDFFARITAEAAVAAHKATKPDWVARGKTLRQKARRWVIRACGRFLWKALRKACARGAVLAPWFVAVTLYVVSAIMSVINQGWLTVLAAAGAGAVPTYWWLGGWAWHLTRRRHLKPTKQRIWLAAAYVAYTVLAVLTAVWRVGVPMPGFWLTTAAAFSIAVAWYRYENRERAGMDERHYEWGRIKKVAGVELGPITDHQEPERWIAEADLSESDMLVENLAQAFPFIAKRYRVPRQNVIVDEVLPGVDALARITVVRKSPIDVPLVYDKTWQEYTEPGCFPFHTYSDGYRGQLRLSTPGSGTVNSLFSGDVGWGKSAGLFAAAIQAINTGRVYPVVLDPQGGQSLPALAGRAGIAPMKASNPEQIYDRLLKIHAGMIARSAYLEGYEWDDKWGDTHVGMGFFDQDVMATQKRNPLFWPIILVILDEAHKACKDPEWGAIIVILFEEIVKLSRKTGIAVWPATQYPGIEELGNKMAIRQNLIAGNVIAYRNSAKTTGTMILDSHMPPPHTIPKHTRDGKQALGFAVISSAAPFSSRAAFSRSVFVERQTQAAEQAAERIMPIDDVTAEAMAAIDAKREEDAVAAQVAAHQAAKAGGTAAQTARQTITVSTAKAAGEPWRQGTVLERCVAYLQHLELTKGVTETTSGILAAETGSAHNAVCMALGRAAKRNPPICHSPRNGTWALGAKPAEELVGSAA